MAHTTRPLPAELISIQQSADKLAVNPMTIRRWIQSGHLTAYRLGPRMVRIDVAELDNQLQVITPGDDSE